MQLDMGHVNEHATRLTPEEADARAAALIAQYRNEAKGARRSRPASQSRSFPSGLGWMVVYLAGVAGGTVWHAKPMIAVMFGILLMLICRAFMKRRASNPEAETE